MRLTNYISLCVLFVFSYTGIAQENVFLQRDYWKNNPSVTKVKEDIKAGNDPAQLNRNAFDAVVYALLEKTNNSTITYLLSLKGNGVKKRTHDSRTYIFWAAYKGNTDIMKHLFDKGAIINITDSHGNTPVTFAAVTGQKNTAIYDLFEKQGAILNQEKNNDGANALLLIAPFIEDTALLDYFVSKGIDLHSTDSNGDGVFNYAAKNAKKNVLNMLIKKGVAYKNRSKDNGNAFIFASRGTRNSKNNIETYKYLETLGIEPNVLTDNKFTPLHALAYKNKDLDIFSYFIKKGVDVNQPDMNGNTAFSNAVYRNDLKSVAFLSKHVTDINFSNKKGVTPLMRAIQSNDSEVASFLIKNGGNIQIKDKDGNSLAYYLLNAFRSQDSKAFDNKLQLLLENGLSMNQTQQEGNTLLHLATQKKDLTLLKRLEPFGIDVNTKNKEGFTALHIAAMKAENDEILKYLIDLGADKTIKTEFEETVLDLASENELLQKQHTQLNFLK